MKIVIKNKEYISDFIELNKDVEVFERKEFKEKKVVILGNFDGVHLGHLELINSAIKKAKSLNLKTILYTFREYPKKSDTLITSLNEKLEILKKIGLDYIYLEEFEDVYKLQPENFVKDILVKKLNVAEIYCGFNYTFGNMKKGDVLFLEKLLENKANVNVINPVVYNLNNDEIKVVELKKLKSYLDKGYYVISSTYIKTLIENGDMEHVTKLLGHEYIIQGKVVEGKKIARTLGFPTANIRVINKKYPIFGVYGVKLLVQNYEKEFFGIMNIGKNPTFENKGINIETHIFDFEDDIYGKIITIKLLKNIRLERKMFSIEELKEQISFDKEIWRNIINEKYRFNS